MEYSTEKEFLQPILDHGMEGMSEVLQNLFNLAMKLERENALKASPYQRIEGRTGYANGFKERHIQSRVGELELQIPQTRNVEFYPSCLERGLRSERPIHRNRNKETAAVYTNDEFTDGKLYKGNQGKMNFCTLLYDKISVQVFFKASAP